MQILPRKVAHLTLLTLAGCAQAPELDEAFLTTGPADAAAAEAGVLPDAGAGGTAGGAGSGGLGSFDAGGQPAGLGGMGGGPGGALAGIDSGAGIVDAAADAASRPLEASAGTIVDTGVAGERDAAPVGPEAGAGATGGGAGGGTTGGGTLGGSAGGGGTPGGGATCNPATCDNECFLLERCCDANNQCACLTPLSRQCTLPSL
jgi:hypothetical protein